MAPDLYHSIFQTSAGWMGFLSSEVGVRRIILPRQSEKEVATQLGENLAGADSAPYHPRDLVDRFIAYFAGNVVTFPEQLDLPEATPFQLKVWEAARLIPFGQVKSYAWVADKIGNPLAVRAVGQALGRNPVPIIVPCHRVVASGGGLGGFSGGLEMKKHLLGLEASASNGR